jgi:hypothetical protein
MTAALNNGFQSMCACADRGRIGEGTLCVYGLICMPLSSKTTKTD